MARQHHFAGCTIKLLTKENPYRDGTKGAKRFDTYRNGMTFEKAMASKHVHARGIMWDVHHKFIEFYES